MSRYNDELKLKLAWQSALEQRTCPGSDILCAETIDDNLQKHLSFCETCRENRAMQLEERTAWQGLLDKMSGKAMQPASDIAKQEGQVWTLKKELGKWQEDGRYFQPPMLLILNKSKNNAVWKVAQLYEDKRLSGNGDVLLDDRFGFAESWNCYDVREASLGLCFGCVKEEELKQVVACSRATYPPVPDGSILSFFRSMELEVGAFVLLPAVVEVLESEKECVFDVIQGLKLAVSGTKNFVLEIAAETLDLLRGTFKPALVLRGAASKPAAAKLTDEQKKMILEHCAVVPVEMRLSGDTLTVSLKWLRDKPVELPLVRVVLNEVDVAYAVFTGTAADKIVMGSPLLSGVLTSQISSLKLSFIENVLMLHITVESH
ncbi:MAG: hypothetical protein PHN84_00110 [Desulfuromonadaceae bacterium]|nr:hypothetical protein [Desulfuromonadaceae bacterium]MDD2854990.1 hypothetical protein [Desulfuromonadaceae bacterium]